MAGTTGSGGKRRGPIVGINVTPMVDVVLVLLVLMMVSATYIVSRSLKVDLPNAKSSDGDAASTAAVTITRERALFFNREPVTEEELSLRLRTAAKQDKAVTLIISADGEATHGAVVGVLDRARLEGITSFAINVERKP